MGNQNTPSICCCFGLSVVFYNQLQPISGKTLRPQPLHPLPGLHRQQLTISKLVSHCVCPLAPPSFLPIPSHLPPASKKKKKKHLKKLKSPLPLYKQPCIPPSLAIHVFRCTSYHGSSGGVHVEPLSCPAPPSLPPHRLQRRHQNLMHSARGCRQ